MTVEIESFDESDAWDMLQDAFGIGEDVGINVLTCEYKEIKRGRKTS